MKSQKESVIFIETHHNFHPYECGGVKEKCVHCIALKNNDTEHTNNCALCEDGVFWDTDSTQHLYKREIKKIL